MEQRNSAVLTITGSLETAMTGVLGTVAHEFFHALNVERIRPAALEPFDFEIAQRMGGISNSVTNARGRRFFSPVEMSRQAPFVDAATSVDPNNRNNTFLSYYKWRSGIGLALDLTLRTRYRGVTLEDVLREMWHAHGVTEVPYEVPDVQAALARVTEDPAFAKDFFDRYVSGRQAPDFPDLLAAAGVRLSDAFPGQAWIGSGLQERGGALVVT